MIPSLNDITFILCGGKEDVSYLQILSSVSDHPLMAEFGIIRRIFQAMPAL
jgi:hypothetical protein